MRKKLLERIVIDPQVLAGKPIIKGTRISVELILKMLAQNISKEEILKEYPHLKDEDIQAALLYALEIISGEEILPLKVGKR